MTSIRRLVLLGATGDLAARFLFPALSTLIAEGRLPDSFRIVASARDPHTDDAFRQLISEQLDHHAHDVDRSVKDKLLRAISYQAVDLTDPSSLAPIVGKEPVAVYCALPPATYSTTIESLSAIGLPRGSRLAIEKPFGRSLIDAQALNRQLWDAFGADYEELVFRVDHVLGMATLHNLLGARLANRTLSAVWNSQHIEAVEVIWDENLTVEDRAGYYDTTGALEDVVQNHLLQVLAIVTMEPPESVSERDLRDARADVLSAVHVVKDDSSRVRASRRARYTAGTITMPDGSTRQVPAYVDEPGVDPSRSTETFAEVRLQIDCPRWHGTSFLMRTGKALRERYKGVVIRFRPVPELPFGVGTPAPNELHIGLDGPESFTLQLTGTTAGPPQRFTPMPLSATLATDELPAYSHVLLDILDGDSARSIRGDEAEFGWSIFGPVFEAWRENRVPLEEYPAGSDGPR